MQPTLTAFRLLATVSVSCCWSCAHSLVCLASCGPTDLACFCRPFNSRSAVLSWALVALRPDLRPSLLFCIAPTCLSKISLACSRVLPVVQEHSMFSCLCPATEGKDAVQDREMQSIATVLFLVIDTSKLLQTVNYAMACNTLGIFTVCTTSQRFVLPATADYVLHYAVRMLIVIHASAVPEACLPNSFGEESMTAEQGSANATSCDCCGHLHKRGTLQQTPNMQSQPGLDNTALDCTANF